MGEAAGAAHGAMAKAFQIRDPDFRDRVRSSFAAQAFMTTIGARLALVEPGRVDVVLPVRANLGQQAGYLHGGALMSVADTAAGYAALTLTDPGTDVLTADISLRIMRPVTGRAIRAIATVLRPGRTLSTVRAEVMDGEDGSGAHLATALFGMAPVARRG